MVRNSFRLDAPRRGPKRPTMMLEVCDLDNASRFGADVDGRGRCALRLRSSSTLTLKGAHMTQKPSEAYLTGYFFGRDGRRTERRFDDVGVEIKAYTIVDGRRVHQSARPT
jgi:hypothetical protein